VGCSGPYRVSVDVKPVGSQREEAFWNRLVHFSPRAAIQMRVRQTGRSGQVSGACTVIVYLSFVCQRTGITSRVHAATNAGPSGHVDEDGF
jgi:hypothetical protein